MTRERLTEEEVRGWTNTKLVETFEVSSRLLLDNDDENGEGIEIKSKNQSVLIQEIYRRMSNHR